MRDVTKQKKLNQKTLESERHNRSKAFYSFLRSFKISMLVEKV